MSDGRVANLLIVGVPKAGTGSLFAYLAQHPDICGSDEKETGYFNHYNPWRHTGPPPPIEEYSRHFAHSTGERYAIEATPTYSYGGRPVISAIRAVLGRPKIILILRDPVDRLWSGYTFQRSVGNNTGLTSFENYLDTLEQDRRDGVALVPNNGRHGLQIGFYSDYVGQWLDEFGEDMRVVFLEDMRRDPRGVVQSLCAWLDIDTDVVADVDVDARNVTRHPRSTRLAGAARTLKRRAERHGLLPHAAYRRMRDVYFRVNSGEISEDFDPALRRRVEDVYRESNRETAEILATHGYTELPSWLRVGSAV
jgi:Sulfotransferase domain